VPLATTSDNLLLPSALHAVAAVSVAAAAAAAGVAVGHHIAMYQRMGSVYDSLPTRKKHQRDPYIVSAC
jgi:hypothetical protein